MTPFKRLVAVAAALVIAPLAACSSGGSTTSSDAASSAAEPSASQRVVVTSGNPKFGQTFMWPDGTTVTMGPPEVFTPDKIYYWGDKTAVKFLFTLENHSGAPLTPMEFEFNAKSADANMGLIVGGGIMDLPAGTLADGDSLELYVGCETVDINDMEMEFDPETDDTHDAVTFTT